MTGSSGISSTPRPNGLLLPCVRSIDPRAGDGIRREWLAMPARSAPQRFGREIGGGSGHGAGVAALGGNLWGRSGGLVSIKRTGSSPICCLFWGENDGLSILPET